MLLGLEVPVFAAVLLIFLLGGILKGILGFGLPLITMALLPFVVPVELAIVLSALVQPATNIGQLVSSGGAGKAFRTIWPVLLTLAIGVAVGASLLPSIEGGLLMLIVGAVVVAFSLYNLSGFQISIPASRKVAAGLGTGLIAGVLGALTSINGPVFIMYLVGLDVSRQAFRSSIALLFVISGLLIGSGFYAVGILNADRLVLSIVILVPCFLGMWMGNHFGKKIPNETFRKIILSALFVIGAGLVVRGFG